MSRDAGDEERGRLDRRAWIEAACAVLVGEGIEQVRILPLAARLGVSRGSFYWHFGSRGELLDALLARWAARNTRALVEAATQPGDFTQRFFSVARCWLDPTAYDPRLDIAVRDWARRDARVAALVHQADDERIAAIAAIFADAGEPPRMAFIRSRVVYFMQMGYYMAGVREELPTRLGYLAEYYQVFTGRSLPPERAAEIAASLGGRA